MASATPRLWTIGYQQRDATSLIRFLHSERISLLLDVRETAWSHKPGLSKSALASRLCRAGIGYTHVTYAGNPKWIRETAATHAECLVNYRRYLGQHPDIVGEFVSLMHDIAEADERPCLLCYERCADECHRGILAEAWAKASGGMVCHLGSDGQYRLMAG